MQLALQQQAFRLQKAFKVLSVQAGSFEVLGFKEFIALGANLGRCSLAARSSSSCCKGPPRTTRPSPNSWIKPPISCITVATVPAKRVVLTCSWRLAALDMEGSISRGRGNSGGGPLSRSPHVDGHGIRVSKGVRGEQLTATHFTRTSIRRGASWFCEGLQGVEPQCRLSNGATALRSVEGKALHLNPIPWHAGGALSRASSWTRRGQLPGCCGRAWASAPATAICPTGTRASSCKATSFSASLHSVPCGRCSCGEL